jgi:thioredoxin 1
MPETKVKHLDDSNFKQAVEQGTVLLDFFSQSCGPCKMMNPIIEELAEELSSQLKVFKIDIEGAEQVVQQFSITHVPTLIVLKDGKEVDRTIGLKDMDDLKALVANS